MAETKIEWADFTFNPWRGCTKVSPACEHCYAETTSKRNPEVLGVWGKHGSRSIAAENYWKLPLKWNQEAKAEGQRKRVFCASLADVFEGKDTMPEAAWEAVEAARIRLFDLIDATPWLDWLLLTKRPELVMPWFRERMWPDVYIPSNVWFGTTVENQEYADLRIPELLDIPVKVRFVSVEPLLGEVDLTPYLSHKCTGVFDGERHGTENACRICGAYRNDEKHGIDWVIVGGESGTDARPFHPDWARDLRDQCIKAEVPFLFKQWGEWVEFEAAPVHRTLYTDSPAFHRKAKQCDGFMSRDGHFITKLRDAVDGDTAYRGLIRPGKKKAGRELDGRTWDELPKMKMITDGTIIGVDFDGTVVKHAYPEIGEDVPGAVEVLRTLQAKGCRLILWTMRSGEYLEDAVQWFADRKIGLFGVNENPEQKSWTDSPKAYAQIYIDDAAFGCPLLTCKGGRPFVDWSVIKKVIEEVLP